MRFGFVVANACVLAGISWMVAFGPNLRAAELLPDHPGLGDVPALESRAALTPTASNVTALAAAYLDRDQPGLASAVIDKAPREVRERPEVAHVEARALYRRGRVREALAAAETAEAACAREAPGADGACPAWLAAKTARQIAFLRQVVAAGIEDPLADPTGTRNAYERSTREVRIVAMR
jgi:hypothetical protein